MCNCIEEQNLILSEENESLRLASSMKDGHKRVTIASITSKQTFSQNRILAAVFCPFCGEKYPPMPTFLTIPILQPTYTVDRIDKLK